MWGDLGKAIFFSLVMVGFYVYQNDGMSSFTSSHKAKNENDIIGARELADRYVVTKADWSYLCKNGPALYHQSVVTVPSGITIRYHYESRDAGSQAKVPVKPIRVLDY